MKARANSTPFLLRTALILLLAILGVLLWMIARGDGTTQAAAPRGELAPSEQAVVSTFKRLSPSVVNITSLDVVRDRLTFNVHEVPQGSGSGFFWDDRGHVVTNYHVIQRAKGAEVALSDGRRLRATLVGVAPDKDLAVLKVEGAAGVKPLPVGSSHDLQVGQSVLAIGNPFGFDQTLTTGIISGLGRQIESVTRRPIHDVIQTDAAINPGNSGGPLIDSAGRLIGVNTAIYSPSGAYAGIGFAVPVDTVARVVPQLIKHGAVQRPVLGVQIAGDQWAKQWGIAGIIVVDVTAGGGAASAGLRGARLDRRGRVVLGDVIVGIGETRISGSDDLFKALDGKQVGDVVKLIIKREGREHSVDVKLHAER